MNPARLAELKHQRALVHEQLAWLEREIAAEGASLPPLPVALHAIGQSSGIREVRILPASSTPLVSSSEFQAADAYQPDPVSAATDTRKGCFVAIAVITLLVVATFIAIYVLRYSDRPLIFMAGDAESSEANARGSAPTSK